MGDNQRLKKVLTFIELASAIQNDGANEENIIKVVSEMQPKIKPFLKLISSEKSKSDDSFVQYNRPQ